MKNVIRAMCVVILLLFALNCNDDDPIQYRLRTEASPEEGGTVSPASATYNKGTEVEIKATANDEYVFKNWSGDTSGDENPMKIMMTDDMVITAVFEKVQYTLNIEIVGEGSVEQKVIQAKTSTDYDSGTIVELTAVPEEEWVFVGWSGDHQGTSNPLTIEMNEAMSLTATFKKVEYTLNIDIEGNGTVQEEIVQAKSSSDYDSGTQVRLTAQPADEWQFVEWSGDLQGSENPITVTMDKPMSVTAKFMPENLEKVYVPDNNFEQALIDLRYDYTLDNYVYAESIKYVEELILGNKQIKDLTGIEGFVNLQKLVANNNELTSLIFTGNEFLDQIILNDNKLTELDLSALGFLKELNIAMNSLSCVSVNVTQLNQEKYSDKAVWWYDNGVYFSLDCNGSDDQLTYVPDDNFEQALIDLGIDDVLDDYVKTVIIINITELDLSSKNISDLTGIEEFRSLYTLDFSDNNISDVSGLENLNLLILLNCSNNDISSIPLDFGVKWGPYPPAPWLGSLNLSNNELSELNISGLNFFRTLDVRNNPLTCIEANENQLSYFEDFMENIEVDEGVIISLDCGN
ncbi:InlB B-repeat-containing protein [Lutimonas vermicola]|uniref:InlB B-repeat-containing protein n=1 Tax=Lutimonas vermicola TaxID=414288 RepID=A0ABU9L4I9_9FLAO